MVWKSSPILILICFIFYWKRFFFVFGFQDQNQTVGICFDRYIFGSILCLVAEILQSSSNLLGQSSWVTITITTTIKLITPINHFWPSSYLYLFLLNPSLHLDFCWSESIHCWLEKTLINFVFRLFFFSPTLWSFEWREFDPFIIITIIIIISSNYNWSKFSMLETRKAVNEFESEIEKEHWKIFREEWEKTNKWLKREGGNKMNQLESIQKFLGFFFWRKKIICLFELD